MLQPRAVLDQEYSPYLYCTHENSLYPLHWVFATLCDVKIHIGYFIWIKGVPAITTK